MSSPETPFFSVVVPTHNRLELLKQSLRSIESQTFKDYEVIVVDDGSEDGTWQFLTELGDRVRAIRTSSNVGPGEARNIGIAKASGSYIAFLDSDDLWFPWTLETLDRVICENGQPAMVSGARKDFFEESDLGDTSAGALCYVAYPDYLSSSSKPIWLGVQGTAVRRDCFDVVRFSSADLNAEDNDLWLRLGNQPGFLFVDSPVLFAYRRHPTSRISGLEKTALGTLRLIASEREGEYPGGKGRARERREIIGRHVRPVVLQCANHGLIGTSFTLFRRTLVWNGRELRFKFIFGALFYMLKALFLTRRGGVQEHPTV